MTANGRYHPAGEDVVGELIEASTTDLLAQAIELDAAPPFGALVRVAGDDGIVVYGVVAHVETAGIDPGARPIMRGHDDVRDGRIYQENPDLPLVLRTTFRAVVVGFGQVGQGDAPFQFLPPRPPRLHYSVCVCSASEVRRFSSGGFDYLSVLLAAPDAPNDELLAANLRYMAAFEPQSGAFLQAAGREIAQLLRADYARLTNILRRCVLPLGTEVRA